MKAVWKFALPGDLNEIEMPIGAEVLSVGQQHGKPCLWALCDMENKRKELRKFRTVGTGTGFDDTCRFVGRFTFKLDDMAETILEWHVFEVKP